MRMQSAFSFALLFVSLSSVSLTANDDSAVLEIQNLIATTYDKPNNKVLTKPVVVSGDYAVAD
jgi:hypothetical protein